MFLAITFVTARLSVPKIRSTFAFPLRLYEEVILLLIPANDAKSRTDPFSNFLSPSLTMRTGFLSSQHFCSSTNLMTPASLDISVPIEQATAQDDIYSTASNRYLFLASIFSADQRINWLDVEQTTDRYLSVRTALFWMILLPRQIATPDEMRDVWIIFPSPLHVSVRIFFFLNIRLMYMVVLCVNYKQ